MSLTATLVKVSLQNNGLFFNPHKILELHVVSLLSVTQRTLLVDIHFQ